LNAFYTANATTISSAATALASAVNLDMKGIENTITTFAETSAVLMKGLDALGQVHPFVGIAVTAFKLVITLDITRRQNNKKVLAVKIQMQDLMTILFQLRHMRDPEEKGPDGTTLKDRMGPLMQSIADSITKCGSACDVYMKKGFLAKTIKSKIYEGRLAGYVTMFAGHKKDIGYALKIHTALGVDAANKKLDGQDVHLRVIEEKMEALFRKLDSPREREVQKFIDDQGGARACVDNDTTLQELVVKSGETLASLDPARAGTGNLATAKKLLIKELSEDVDEAFRKNMKLFDRKLEMQSKQLTDTISATGEHIISVLSGGAHEKILDADMQAIWKEQGWKGSVKARHFVLALNDYYTEKFADVDVAVASAAASVAGSVPGSPLMSPAVADPNPPPDAQPEDDRWALAYINVAHLQPILEAIDDDGTGFVSIREANDFAVSRPAGWSLLSWVAFWARGWHATVTWYKNRIYALLAAMLSLVKRIKTANVQAADTYLAGGVIRRVELLLRSTRSAPGKTYDDPRLTRIADAFQDAEEERVRTQLDGLLYELDDIATLRLITGPRRIERYVYPLIYTLLKRHFDIMRLAAVHVLDSAEFDMMAASIATVFKAVDERTKNLEAIFKSTSIDVKDRLGNFAFGMLTYGGFKRDPIHNTLFEFEEEDGFECEDDEDLGPDSDDDEETTKAILARMTTASLRYETQNEPSGMYNFETLHPPPPIVDPLDGAWTGQLIDMDGNPIEGTMSLVLKREEGKLGGAAENLVSILTLDGTVAEEHKVVFTINWPDGYGAVCTGRYDPETDTITGSWDDKEDDEDSSSESSDEAPFVFRRTPPAVFRFRYTDAQFKKNRARARWGFAIAAAMDEIQRTRMTWPYLKKRFTERRRYIELVKRDKIEFEELTPWTRLTDDESAELFRLKSDLRPCDARFYDSVAEFELQHLAANRDCDSCNRSIRDTRHFCIQCMDDRYDECIDLCSECVDQTPERDAFVHTKSHVLIKTYRRIHDSEISWLVPEARVVADRVKKRFKTANSLLARIEGAAKPGGHTSKSKVDKSQRYCCCCGEVMATPCWVCIDCSDDTYVCMDCDAKRATALTDGVSPNHTLSDPLVQILDSEPIPEPLTTDLRLSELETKMVGLDSKIAALEEKLDTRFGSLETILQSIADRLTVKE
ncbi:hypothetical protein C8R43DRAFT_886602, partial [Mycena crocata]